MCTALLIGDPWQPGSQGAKVKQLCALDGYKAFLFIIPSPFDVVFEASTSCFVVLRHPLGPPCTASSGGVSRLRSCLVEDESKHRVDRLIGW